MNESSVLYSYYTAEVTSVCCPTYVATESRNDCMIFRQVACESSDKLLVNKRYCNVCIDVPESTTVKCEPGDCCTFVCSTIKQVCVCVRACFSKESRY